MSSRIGFDAIIGQELATKMLSRSVREEHPGHAYLFLGLRGTGKTRTAVEFAKALNCENPQEGNACGNCAICSAIDHGNFPDITIWPPDSKSGQETTIDAMRSMRELANYAPTRGTWKVNIVEQADTLNEHSANCILKVLEEPPAYVINILLYRNAANVLPTIRSRCQLVRFTQVSADDLAARLMEDFHVEESEAQFLATYSQGCPGRAIELIGNEAFFERRNAIISVAEQASSNNPWVALKLAGVLRSSVVEQSLDDDDQEDDQQQKPKKKSSRDSVIESLDILVTWYRDLLALRLQGPDAGVVNVDRLEDLKLQVRTYKDPNFLANAVSAILKAKRGILGNANTQMTTEALMMRLVK